MSKIQESLSRLFEHYKVIIWYDEIEDFRDDWESLQLVDVNKVLVNNNEFAVKHLIYIEKPDERFLLYIPYARPDNEENWLLDLELSNYLFHTDREAMILQELDLPISLRGWLKPHVEFFRSKERISNFNQVKQSGDNEHDLSLRLLQVVINADSINLDELVTAYAKQFAFDKSEEIEKELNKFSLQAVFWDEVKRQYEYESKGVSIYNLLLEMFQKSFTPLSDKAKLNHNAEVLVSKWKDRKSFEKSFRVLSRKIEKDLRIEELLEKLPLSEIIDDDSFESIDKRIIIELVERIVSDSISLSELEKIIKKRQSKFWANEYSAFYRALERALRLIEDVKRYENIEIKSYNDGFKQYTTRWYTVDQCYREFIQYYREVKQNRVLASLYEWVHKIYSNNWLINLSNKWQQFIDRNDGWYKGELAQSNFFERVVNKYFNSKPNSKLFVIISDGFRYECGKILNDYLNDENRFISNLEYQVTNLPSYTQLGMASLLPHNKLSFGEGGTIIVDGISSLGTNNRIKILQENSGYKATAVLAENLMHMNTKGEEAKRLVQDHDLIYVYHNRIDGTGDDTTSEDKVIEASKEEIDFLMDVVKKIANMNGTNMIITADHGFIYQNEMIEESDFSDGQISGDIDKGARRYVIGSNLEHNQNVFKLSAGELNIDSNKEVLIPKGIQRLRKQGSGSRYVHGGATLQETVVPVLFISKKRADTVSKVDVDILNKANDRITTNIHTVKFYQMQPVSDGFIARTIKAYFALIENGEKTAISDSFTFTFDLTSERTEEREVSNRFTISTHLKRSTNVYLVLEEKVDKSDKWIQISKIPYRLSLLMGNDFDDF
ncbi:MAG: BREX-1 system phosphatase PglZ type A [Bacteroidales bacterium]|jgi:uncharacterized protein (TIGR02687 family)